MLLVSFQIGALLVGPVLTISEKRATYSKIVQRTSLILVLALILVAVAGELPGGAVQLALIMVVLIPFGLAVNLYAGCISLVGFIGTLAISALVSFVSLWIILAVEGVLLGLLMIVANRTRWFADLDAVESDAGTTAIDRIRRHHNGRLRYGFASFGHSLEPLSVGHHRTREEAHGAGRAADPGNPPVSGTGLTNPPG